MRIEHVEHIGLAVKNLDEALKFYTGVLGVASSEIERKGIPDLVEVAVINTKGSKIELVHFLGPNDPVARFVDQKTDSIYHFAINVDNILEALEAVKKDGGTLIHEKPIQTPSGRKFAYVQPKNSKVLIELLED